MTKPRPLNHTGTVRLETERLILRHTSVSDAAEMFSNWASDPQVCKFMTWQPHANIEETKEILAKWEKDYEKSDFYHWGIEIKETGKLIGTGGFVKIHEQHYSAELGYCLSRAEWNKGYTSEAAAAMIAHLFDAVGVNRIAACHRPDNAASGRVMQKCGMMLEGTERQARFYAERGFCDLVWYAIIRDDFI